METGVKNEVFDVVNEKNTALAMGSGCLNVYATPAMCALMEKAACLSIEPFLEEGQSSVGTHVDVSHLSATPAGMKVWADSEVVAIDRRKITFSVKAYDERGLIGEGTHDRFIINIDKFQTSAQNK